MHEATLTVCTAAHRRASQTVRPLQVVACLALPCRQQPAWNNHMHMQAATFAPPAQPTSPPPAETWEPLRRGGASCPSPGSDRTEVCTYSEELCREYRQFLAFGTFSASRWHAQKL